MPISRRHTAKLRAFYVSIIDNDKEPTPIRLRAASRLQKLVDRQTPIKNKELDELAKQLTEQDNDRDPFA